MVIKKGFEVVNIDSTICLEEPKIKLHAAEMRKKIAELTGITDDDVSVKATTTEKLGFIGKGKGIMAYATVLLKKKN